MFAQVLGETELQNVVSKYWSKPLPDRLKLPPANQSRRHKKKTKNNLLIVWKNGAPGVNAPVQEHVVELTLSTSKLTIWVLGVSHATDTLRQNPVNQQSKSAGDKCSLFDDFRELTVCMYVCVYSWHLVVAMRKR